MSVPELSKGRASTVAFANPKGGSGRTSTCLSVAGYLAKGDCRVLVVDFDPQGNATSALGIDKKALDYTMYDALVIPGNGAGRVSIKRVIVETDVENLHLAPAEFDLAAAEHYMSQAADRAFVLDRAIEPIRAYYHFILIDLPPGYGLLGLNGLCAADAVIVPVDPSAAALESLQGLREAFREIRRHVGRTPHVMAAVVIRHVAAGGGSLSPAQEIEVALRDMVPAVYTVPCSDDLYATQKQGLPISHFAPQSAGGKAYERIARAIRKQLEKATA